MNKIVKISTATVLACSFGLGYANVNMHAECADPAIKITDENWRSFENCDNPENNMEPPTTDQVLVIQQQVPTPIEQKVPELKVQQQVPTPIEQKVPELKVEQQVPTPIEQKVPELKVQQQVPTPIEQKVPELKVQQQVPTPIEQKVPELKVQQQVPTPIEQKVPELKVQQQVPTPIEQKVPNENLSKPVAVTSTLPSATVNPIKTESAAVTSNTSSISPPSEVRSVPSDVQVPTQATPARPAVHIPNKEIPEAILPSAILVPTTVEASVKPVADRIPPIASPAIKVPVTHTRPVISRTAPVTQNNINMPTIRKVNVVSAPIAQKLPQTGEASQMSFYLFGLGLVALGLGIAIWTNRKRKEL